MWWREGRGVRKRGGREVEEVHNSPPAHITTCLHHGRRSSTSLFVALVDNTTTDHWLSPHSSPDTIPTALEGTTSELGDVQTDRQNTDTVDLTTCHIVSAVTAILAGHITSSPSLTPSLVAVW
ncbi:hypothetical protein BLNAU_20801 [Blattamonas nauphoetae]|uniref:Uncharacterized protein n=1 Tax=Blattamonas nauphoetae TaxID=2049346 RepID=A0ABQ9X1Y0_9EUKA|nr:hypothetical protein BLNAU_20801 [Blattamonas nauphoetae]